MSKLLHAALAAKTDGYKYMISVVKSVFHTTYYHVVDLDTLIANGGKWPAAPRGSYPSARDHNSSWHGRVGTSTPPAKSIRRTVALAHYCH